MKITDNTRKNLIIRMIIIAMLVGWAAFTTANLTAQAQTPAQGTEAPKTESAEKKEGETTEAALEESGDNAALAEAGEFNLLKSEDPAIWVLLVLMLVGLVVGIERLIVFMKNKSANAELVRILTEELNKNPATGDALAKTVSDKKYGVEGRIAAVTLKGWEHGVETISEYAHAATVAERRYLSTRLPILSTLGNNAPFIGLLGTVLGIMKAFRDLASAADAGPQVVMKGISEALVATATGLAVAIPAVMLFNYFSSIIKRKMSNSEEIVAIIQALRISTKGQGQ